MLSNWFTRLSRAASSRNIAFTSTTAAAMWTNQSPTSPENTSYPVRKYEPRHKNWPYHEDDFIRGDESSDTRFYNQPRYVAHIDDAALSRLASYYDSVLPREGRILDLCTSWRSWYPEDCEKAVCENKTLEVFGIGMSEPEMVRNPLFRGFTARFQAVDLNEGSLESKIRWPDYESSSGNVPRFNSVTCAVSIDYLVNALDVLKIVRNSMVDQGKIHLIISNRCFPTKAVRIWLELGTEERLQLVGDYLHFSGWKDIEIVDLCARDGRGNRANHLDPLWVVRGTKVG